MKTNLVLLAAVLGLAFLGIIFWKKNHPAFHPCQGIEFKTWVRAPGDTVRWELEYVCEEVILNPAVENVDEVRDYLDSLNFHRIDSCACPGKLELYSNTDINVDGVNVGDVVKNSPPPTNGIGGLSLNYILPSPDPTDFTTTTPIGPANVNPPQGPTIRVAIVDSGVDTSCFNEPEDSAKFLFNFLVPLTKTACSVWPRRFGFDVIQSETEFLPLPNDKNGHGTHVNGIVAGYPDQAKPSVIPGAPVSLSSVRLELLNVKFTVGKTKSGKLFDAVCGLYYALTQDAPVINVSWGYLDTVAPEMMKPLLAEAYEKNVMIVAAMGNDSLELSSFLRFWPAGFALEHRNVISVGAANNDGNLAGFSNWSADPYLMNVVAPGVDIVSTYPEGMQGNASGIAKNSGTSMAAPFVTRTVALMIGGRVQVNPSYDVSSIKTHLIGNANPERFANQPNYLYYPVDVLTTWEQLGALQ